jgi:FtsH-binding integral membrane protein
MYDDQISISRVEIEQRYFMIKVYGWMALALAVTGFTSLFVASSRAFLEMISSNSIIFFVLIISEILLVGFLVTAVRKMSAQVATLVFIGYSILNGITLSLIFLLYTESSIASTFFITAGTFGAMSIYGYFTKRDLTSLGGFMTMGLIGLIIASLVNIFLQNETVYWLTTYIGVLIFVGLTAYDTQKIKEMNIIGNEGTEEDKKEAIMGALRLYLDFINLFLLLLRLFGNRK